MGRRGGGCFCCPPEQQQSPTEDRSQLEGALLTYLFTSICQIGGGGEERQGEKRGRISLTC